MRWWLMLAGLVPAFAGAQTAGPPRPAPPGKAAAEQAIADLKAKDEPAVAKRRCRRAPGEEVVVCGETDGRSPYRLPLPGERENKEVAGGVAAAGIVGGSPVHNPAAGGLNLSFGAGQKAKIKPKPQ